jgi:cell division protein FtsQ
VVAALAVALILLVGGWLWLRDSSLVGVKRVTVVGATGPDASRIRAALIAAAHKMTTLDADTSRLRAAVSRFAVVKDLKISTQFPHGMKIELVEQIPVAVIAADGHRIAVAGDGRLLRDVRPYPSLPAVSVQAVPRGPRLTDRKALAAVAVLGAAPYQLLTHVGRVTADATHGVVVDLRHGPSVYFGDLTLLGSKWTAAADVLADPGSAGASYIDVVDPARPAAGSSGSAGPSGSASPSSGTGGTSGVSTGASPVATGASAAATVPSGASPAATSSASSPAASSTSAGGVVSASTSSRGG